MSEWMDSQFDLSYGGRLDYCLDYDNSLYTANTNIYNSDGDGSDIVRFEYSLNPQMKKQNPITEIKLPIVSANPKSFIFLSFAIGL